MDVTTKISSTSPHDTQRPGRWYYTLVVVVMLTAIWLRFDGVTNVGVRYEDDAWYVSDAQLWHRCAQVLVDGQAWEALLHHDKAAYQQRMKDIGVDFSGHYRKPSQGYTLSAATIMFLVGDGPHALLLLNAFFGTLAVLIVYFLCRHLFNPAIALTASALLAVSPYHLIYSRSALAHTTAGCLALLGMYLWVLGRTRSWSTRRTFLLSGLAVGFAATCHYSVAYFAGIPLLMEFITRRRSHDSSVTNSSTRAHWLRATVWMCLGFAIPFFAIESIFISARIVATLTDSYLPLDTFFQGIAQHVKLLFRGETVGDRMIHMDVAWSMVNYFTHWHGWIALSLTLGGTGLLLSKRNTTSIAAWIVLATAMMLLLQSHPIARGLNGALPFIMICMAVAVNQLMQLWPKNPKLIYFSVTMLMCFILTPAMRQSLELKNKSSNLAQACQYLNTVASGKIIVPNYRRYWIHLEHSHHAIIEAKHWVRTQTPEQTLQHWLDDGIRWVTIDPQFWHSHPGSTAIDWWHEMENLLIQQFTKVAQYPHLSNYRWEFLAEGSWGQFRLDAMNKADGGAIRIYDLQGATSPHVTRQIVDTMDAKKRQG